MSVDITLVYAFIVAVITAMYLNRALFEPVGRILDERAARLEQDGKDRETALADHKTRVQEYEDKMKAARKEAWDRREAIRREANDARSQTLDAARVEAQATIASGRGEIEQAASEARESLTTESQAMARDVASRILGRALSA